MKLLLLLWNRCCVILLSSIFFSVPVLAGDITSLNNLGFQAASDVADAQVLPTDWSAAVFLKGQKDIELQPEQSANYLGRTRKFGLNLGRKLGDKTDLLVGLRLIHESVSFKTNPNGFWKSPKQQGGDFSLALRQELYQQRHLSLAVIPYLEPGYGPSDSFAIASKSRAGFILASGLDYENWNLLFNFGYRYRPVEFYGPYRLSNDYHFSTKISWKVNPFYFHAEIHERNLFVLSTQKRRPSFERIVSQYYRLAASIDAYDLRWSFYWGSSLANKTFGLPAQELGAAVSWAFGSTGEKLEIKVESIDVEPDLEPGFEEVEEREEGEEYPAEDSRENTEDEDGDFIEPGMESPDSPILPPFDSDIERLDQIEDRLQNMSLVEEEHGPMPTFRESELFELQLGEEKIRRLNKVREVFEEKEALDRIRQKMQEKQKHNEEQQEQAEAEVEAAKEDSNQLLLEQLDQKADEAEESP